MRYFSSLCLLLIYLFVYFMIFKYLIIFLFVYFMIFKYLFIYLLICLFTYRIDHGFELNTRDEVESILSKNPLSILFRPDNVHTMTTGCITILFGFFQGRKYNFVSYMWMLPPLLKAKHRD